MNYALLIGVNKYNHFEQLMSPNYNIQKLKGILERFDFEVSSLSDFRFSTPDLIENYCQKLSTKSDSNDTIFIYYCGRTAKFERDNSNIFSLSHPFSIKGKPSTFINLTELIEKFNKLHQKLIFIIDSKFEINFSNQLLPLNDNLDIIITNNDINIVSQNSTFTEIFYNELSIAFEFQKQITFQEIIANLKSSFERFNETFPFQFLNENYTNTPLFNPIHGENSLLSEYVIRNIFNVSVGSRFDALNDLEYLYNHDELLFESAKKKLKYLASFDKNEQIRQKSISILKNEGGKLDLFDLSTLTKMSPEFPDFLHINEGEFVMGENKSNELANESDTPSHTIYLENYKISKKPITNMQYAQFVFEKNYSFPDHWLSLDILNTILEHPVVNVNWYDCIEYCRWLEEKLYNCLEENQQIILPSEAEWEKACRGTEKRFYPWGNEFIQNNCNTLNSKIQTTTPIGKYSPHGDSPYKCEDMSGNIWEWTRSIWGKSGNKPHYKYPYKSNDGREDLNSDETFRRVIRGGGYYYDAECVCCFTRNRAYTRHKHNGGGFRIVISKKN